MFLFLTKDKVKIGSKLMMVLFFRLSDYYNKILFPDAMVSLIDNNNHINININITILKFYG